MLSLCFNEHLFRLNFIYYFLANFDTDIYLVRINLNANLVSKINRTVLSIRGGVRAVGGTINGIRRVCRGI
jgi:hypothetical protein